ncbi:MAG: ATP-binding protein [Bacteroidetes bacterium]|nr:ATP-binding protein [Bacteroidota bacterium]
MSFLNKQNDSAFYYFNRVAASSKDSVEIATAYNIMATIQSDAGDYYGSQESLLASLKYLKEQNVKDHYSLLSDYNELGTNSQNLKNYDASIEYYDQALKFIKDDNFKIITLNNKALVYQKMKKYTQAISIYQSILGQSKADRKEYARILTNLAITRWLQDSTYRSAPDLLEALQIRKDEKDDWGLNSSYAHLSDYYAHSRPDSALFYADRMYAIAQQLNSPDDQMEALQKLISLSPAKALKQYFERYQHLNDSVQTARNSAKNQFALIRYEAEKSKADNLRLQKDNIQQRIIFYGTVSIFAVILGIAVAWYRKRRQRMQWESENAVRESQLKTSKKVHDVVANGLYRLMTEVEYQESINKEHILDRIEVLYEESRRISYDQPQKTNYDFQELIAGLVMSFASPAIKVATFGDDKALLNNLNDRTKVELEQILQELMINMKKHSFAQSVFIKFEQLGDQLQIQYTDDGVGLPAVFRYGNGLTNTENRIRDIGGRIIFDKSTRKGLKILIQFPII